MYVDWFWTVIGGCSGVVGSTGVMMTLSAIAISIRVLCYRIIG